jgi:hypothetical protein
VAKDKHTAAIERDMRAREAQEQQRRQEQGREESIRAEERKDTLRLLHVITPLSTNCTASAHPNCSIC